jgi:hypothetical protein
MNSKTYTGFLPAATPDFDAPPPSIVRHINAHHPVTNVSSPAIACNLDARPISDNGKSRVGTVTAGSDIEFHWGKGFPHAGPAITYMARCEPDCASFLGTEGKVWFKISEGAFEGDAWVTETLGATGYLKSRVPVCLAPGEYLVRHEIVSMTECARSGRCQIYPSCAQVKVVGSGIVRPDELVAFPGAYKKDDRGILWDTNKLDAKMYRPPGPPIFSCPT